MLNPIKNHLDELNKLLNAGKTQEVVDALKDMSLGTQGPDREMIMSFSRRFKKLRNEEMMKMSTSEETEVGNNVLVRDIQRFFDDLANRKEQSHIPPPPIPKPKRINMSKALREAFCYLYDDVDTAVMVADDVGIEKRNYDSSGSLELVWRGILKEAEKRKLIDALIDYALASDQYPTDEKLLAIQAGRQGGASPNPSVQQVQKTQSAQTVSGGQSGTAARTQTAKSQAAKKPKIYFSYAWGDSSEEGESREKIVNELYKSLEADNIDVLRDKFDLGYGESINKFMKDIGAGDLILVFLSDKYLRSAYCMNEMRLIYLNAREDEADFTRRILPIAVERIKLKDVTVLDEYMTYWSEELRKKEEFAKKWLTEEGQAQQEERKAINKIKDSFMDMVGYVQRINSSSKKLLSENDFAMVKKAINSRLSNE